MDKQYRTKVIDDSTKMVFSVVPDKGKTKNKNKVDKKNKVKSDRSRITHYDFKKLSNKGRHIKIIPNNAKMSLNQYTR